MMPTINLGPTEMALSGCSHSPEGVVSDSRTKRKVKSLPFGIYLRTVLALCLAGLLLSIYLAVSHHRVHTDIGFQGFCALSKSINCDTVSQSPYSILGPLPVAVWGVAGYGSFCCCSFSRHFHRPGAGVYGHCAWQRRSFLVSAARHSRRYRASDRQLLYTLHRHLCDQFPAGVFHLDHPAALSSRPAASGIHPGSAVSLAETKIQHAYFNYLYDRDALDAPFFPAVLADNLAVRVHVDQNRHHRRGLPVDRCGKAATRHHGVHRHQCFQCRKMHYYLRELLARHPTRSG